MSSLIGATIGGYQITKQLGQGGMGAVFLARRAQGRAVALKILQIRDDGELESAGQRFLDEATAATAVTSPHLVPILGSGFDETYGPFIIYEYMSGGSLHSRLQELGKLSAKEVMEGLTPSLLNALAALHDCEVFHRDVKPENILCDGKGNYLLGDLGLATFEGRRAKTRTGIFVGTPGFMAPERIINENNDNGAAGDIYAASAVIVKALSGKSPFRGKTPAELIKEQLQRDIKTKDLTELGVHRQYAPILAKALQKEPSKRPSDCRSFLSQLQSPQKATSLAKTQLNVEAPKAENKPSSPLRFLPLIAALLMTLFFGLRYFQKSSVRMTRGREANITLSKRINSWSYEIDTLIRLKKKDKKTHLRLIDIHGNFHKSVKDREDFTELSLSIESKLLQSFIQCELAMSRHLDEVLLKSSTYLYDLDEELQKQPDWVACWHLHLLLRMQNAEAEGARESLSAIRRSVTDNPLIKGMREELIDFIKKQHQSHDLSAPKIVGASSRNIELNTIFKEGKKAFRKTIKLGKTLDNDGLNNFSKRPDVDRSKAYYTRNEYCKRLLNAYWLSYTGLRAPSFQRNFLLRNLTLMTRIISAKFGVTKKLLSNSDFQWGPALSDPWLFEEAAVIYRAIVKESNQLPGKKAWILQLEVYDQAHNCIQSLTGPQQRQMRYLIKKVVTPAFSQDSPVGHLLTARMLFLDLHGNRSENAKLIYEAALGPTKRAFALVLKELKADSNLPKWHFNQSTILRKVLELRLTVLNYTDNKETLAKEVNELLPFAGKFKVNEPNWQRRNFRLDVAVMQATLLQMENKAFTNDIKAQLEHAENFKNKYDFGRRRAAIRIMTAERYK